MPRYILYAADSVCHARTRYVAKVIFTYILGYKVDVGHMEAVNLISSSKYSEKQIVRLNGQEYVCSQLNTNYRDT